MIRSTQGDTPSHTQNIKLINDLFEKLGRQCGYITPLDARLIEAWEDAKPGHSGWGWYDEEDLMEKRAAVKFWDQRLCNVISQRNDWLNRNIGETKCRSCIISKEEFAHLFHE